MRLHRFYLNTELKGKRVKIDDEVIVHQWRNVFRYNVGNQVVLFDGSGFEYVCTINVLNNREAEVEVLEKRGSIIPKNKITLFQAIVKKDKMEWVVEKATELGVSKIVPTISERSEKKNINMERLRKIAIEASEQCGRGDVPEVGESVDYEECIMNYGKGAFIFHTTSPLATPDPLLDLGEGENIFHDSKFKLHNSVLFIGPEGGWSEKEVELAKAHGAQIHSLGPLTLRAETAAIAALAKLVI